MYETSIHYWSIEVNKCNASYNNTDGPFAKLYIPGIVKNTNVKVFNLMSRTNETRNIEWRETCKCKCRLDAKVDHSKNVGIKINADMNVKMWLKKTTDMINNLSWNPSIDEYECDKSCGIEQYLSYKNRKCRKELIDKLVE